MNTIETPITKEKVAALVADAFQDSEYFLPKIALQDQLGLDVEVISLKRDPIEIYSNFSRIGLLKLYPVIYNGVCKIRVSFFSLFVAGDALRSDSRV